MDGSLCSGTRRSSSGTGKCYHQVVVDEPNFWGNEKTPTISHAQKYDILQTAIAMAKIKLNQEEIAEVVQKKSGGLIQT